MECHTQTEWNMWCKYLTEALSLGRWDSLATSLGNWTWQKGQQDSFFVEKKEITWWRNNKGVGIFTPKYQAKVDN